MLLWWALKIWRSKIKIYIDQLHGFWLDKVGLANSGPYDISIVVTYESHFSFPLMREGRVKDLPCEILLYSKSQG